MIYRCIAPSWLLIKNPSCKKVLEGNFSLNEIKTYNAQGYNIYWLPNCPKEYNPNETVNGTHIDSFNYVFVDFDLKDQSYKSKDEFIEHVITVCPIPSKIIDSGNGVHVYWKVSDLDALSYLRLSRRMMRFLRTDEAVGQIFQLMRFPDTLNTKTENALKLCYVMHEDDISYTCEELDKVLPPIKVEDESYCKRHYEQTYNIQNRDITVDLAIPAKFGVLLHSNKEAKHIWAGDSNDRSKDDYRLGHIMFANEFSKEEAISVLVNSAKALARAPIHRLSYAQNIVDKIWTYETAPQKSPLNLSSSIASILRQSKDVLKGTKFSCHPRVDNTVHGFRLGQVMGLVAGVGVGKTAFALNLFQWFSQNNPDYHHMFIPLEQPANEIVDRWQIMSNSDDSLNEKIHVMSNYDDHGNYRHLSLDDISKYIIDWQNQTGNKLGCVVIDHIGVLKKKNAKDENQDLITLCQSMKAFAVKTNTFLVMQSQTNREKAGIGDLELNKDAAYGTVLFEAFCDYLVTIWQPLKRCHKEQACPTISAFKFCKIRHKKAKKDIIQEDVPYYLYFDSETESLRDLTQIEEESFKFYLKKATNLRKLNRHTDIIEYKSVPYKMELEPCSQNLK